MDFKKVTLITGAGFTKNFGGFLASEMWSVIFNNSKIHVDKMLRTYLFNKADYEEVYEYVLYRAPLDDTDDMHEKRIKLFTEVLLESYEQLDSIVRNWVYRRDASFPINHYGLDGFLNKFTGGGKNEKGFIFTLNQDLFIERKYINGRQLHYPCINYPDNLNSPTNRDAKLSSEMYIAIPEGEISEETREEELQKGNSFYVKLHGSFNWLTSDRNRLIITGQRKYKDIQRVGLLNWYWELFNQVVTQGDVKIVIIGYSFRDKHLNEVLEKAIFENNAKLFIVSPDSFHNLLQTVKDFRFDRALKHGLAGYYPVDLLSLFPADQSKTYLLESLEERLFA